AEVDSAMSHGWTEQVEGRPGHDYHCFVDLGAVHDPTVICVGHTDGDVAFIDRLVTYQGSREEPVQLATVEQGTSASTRSWSRRARCGRHRGRGRKHGGARLVTLRGWRCSLTRRVAVHRRPQVAQPGSLLQMSILMALDGSQPRWERWFPTALAPRRLGGSGA